MVKKKIFFLLANHYSIFNSNRYLDTNNEPEMNGAVKTCWNED